MTSDDEDADDVRGECKLSWKKIKVLHRLLMDLKQFVILTHTNID